MQNPRKHVRRFRSRKGKDVLHPHPAWLWTLFIAQVGIFGFFWSIILRYFSLSMKEKFSIYLNRLNSSLRPTGPCFYHILTKSREENPARQERFWSKGLRKKSAIHRLEATTSFPTTSQMSVFCTFSFENPHLGNVIRTFCDAKAWDRTFRVKMKKDLWKNLRVLPFSRQFRSSVSAPLWEYGVRFPAGSQGFNKNEENLQYLHTFYAFFNSMSL